MAKQTVIQVRVNTELKEQVTEIYKIIGIDIPTAVRMFFKATLRDQGLPFSTKPARKFSQTEQQVDNHQGNEQQDDGTETNLPSQSSLL